MAHRQGETSYKETAFGIIPRSKLIPLEIEGIHRVWQHALKTIRPGTRITPPLLLRFQKIGFGWIFPDTAGRFRRIDVEVSDHKPPPFFRVPQLMHDFTEDLQERLKYLPSIDDENDLSILIDLLAWAHHRFLWIHPFPDYNGRLARLLTNIILLKLELPPIELRVETKRGRDRYIKALQDADKGQMEKLKALIREAIEEAIEELSSYEGK